MVFPGISIRWIHYCEISSPVLISTPEHINATSCHHHTTSFHVHQPPHCLPSAQERKLASEFAKVAQMYDTTDALERGQEAETGHLETRTRTPLETYLYLTSAKEQPRLRPTRRVIVERAQPSSMPFTMCLKIRAWPQPSSTAPCLGGCSTRVE